MNLENWDFYVQKDLKIGLSTYEVIRYQENVFEINSTSNGWVSALISKIQLSNLLNGKLSILDINFK